ncbi:glycosyltransferase [Rivularia sp. IAM M-261]|nr:glycosyltransferase [Calothrix sp. PCC 7716]GJD17909.1 glycosyltransferase [Rivularia sp. IAM M-261]
MDNPLLSIIVPTLHRVNQVEALLNSIVTSNYKNCEILIIDQNFSNLLDTVVDKYLDKIKINHFKVDFRSLSKAKNYGYELASGNIICFPDDDSEVFPETFSNAVSILQNTNSDAVFGKCVERDLSDSVIKFEKDEGYFTSKKYEGMFLDATIFIRKDIFKKYLYDESFGVGAFYGAEEGYDLVLRMLKDNVKMYFSPNILFYHPRKISTHTSFQEIKRVFTYRCGFSHLCLKHKLYTKLISRTVKVSFYILYLAIFERVKIRYYLSELLGILVGITVR